MLTTRQIELLSVIAYRRKYNIATVQRDLCEALGIRRDSLNKLLARTRESMESQGLMLVMPPRSNDVVSRVGSLSNCPNE